MSSRGAYPHFEFMITQQIWNAIQRPPRIHPLFQFVPATPPSPKKPIAPNNFLLPLLALITIFALISREFSSILSLGLLLLIPLAAARLVLTGPIYGLRWAIQSAQALARLRRSGTYDLLCLTPPGPLNVNWLTAAAALYRMFSLYEADFRSLWPPRMFLALPLVVYLSLQSGVIEQPMVNVIVMSLYLTVLLLWFRIEDMQSMVMGGLLGMLASTYTQDRLEARALAAGGFVTILVSSYIAAIIPAYYVLPQFYALYELEGWLADLTRPILALLILAAGRELLLRMAWQHLTNRLHTSSEVSLMTGWRV